MRAWDELDSLSLKFPFNVQASGNLMVALKYMLKSKLGSSKRDHLDGDISSSSSSGGTRGGGARVSVSSSTTNEHLTRMRQDLLRGGFIERTCALVLRFVDMVDFCFKGCQALALMLDSDEARRIAYKAGGCIIATKCLSMHAVARNVCLHSCTLVCALACDNEDNKQALRDLGVCEMLIAVLDKQVGIWKVEMWVCRAIVELCHGDDANKNRFILYHIGNRLVRPLHWGMGKNVPEAEKITSVDVTAAMSSEERSRLLLKVSENEERAKEHISWILINDTDTVYRYVGWICQAIAAIIRGEPSCAAHFSTAGLGGVLPQVLSYFIPIRPPSRCCQNMPPWC